MAKKLFSLKNKVYCVYCDKVISCTEYQKEICDKSPSKMHETEVLKENS